MNIALCILAGVPAMAWLCVLLHPARPWDGRPIAEDEPQPPAPASWPSVRIVVPARNEAETLPKTLPALIAQDYPGRAQVVVVDDRSTDSTAAAVPSPAAVVRGAPLPDGWVGKVWAMRQGAAGAAEDYLLFTDADILHAPHTLRRLVAESEAQRLALNSRMSRLRTDSAAERLLIPAYVWFFNLLYPMRRVNDPKRRTAAAAGGCMLVRRDALERAGGLDSIRDAIIDDVALARRIKPHGPIRLSSCRSDVRSLRASNSLAPIWRMVRRTAFCELRYSWLRVLGVMIGMALFFLTPPVVLSVGLAFAEWPAAALAGFAWLEMSAAYIPALRHHGLGPHRALLLPLVGLLYAGMTFDSGLRGRRRGWRDESDPSPIRSETT